MMSSTCCALSCRFRFWFAFAGKDSANGPRPSRRACLKLVDGTCILLSRSSASCPVNALITSAGNRPLRRAARDLMGTPLPPYLAKSWKQSFQFGNAPQNLERVEFTGKILQHKELLAISCRWRAWNVLRVVNNREKAERTVTRSIRLPGCYVGDKGHLSLHPLIAILGNRARFAKDLRHSCV